MSGVKVKVAVDADTKALERFQKDIDDTREHLIKSAKDVDELTKGLRKLDRQQRALNKVTGQGTQQTSKLKSLFGGFVITAGDVANAVRTVADTTWGAVKAYAESEAVQARLERSVRSAVGDYGAWDQKIQSVIASQSRLAAVDDEEVSTSLALLVQATGDVNEALALNQVALDLSRAKGKDLTSTATVLGKAYNGNVGALKRYGVAVKDGATATEALGELQAKYAGQAEAYGDSTAGSIDRMSIALENANESFGEFATQTLHLDNKLDDLSGTLDRFNAATGPERLLMFARGIGNIALAGAGATPMLVQLKNAKQDLIDAMKTSTVATEAWTKTTYNAEGAAKRYEAALQGVNDTIAARDDAELSSLQAKERVKDAEKNLTAEIKEHGKKSREARIAQLELNKARREAKIAADKYAASVDEAKDAEARAAKEKAIQEWLRTLRDRWRDVYREAAGYQRIVNSINVQTPGRSTAGPQRFASGGIVTAPTFALVGEAGSDEAVIPINSRQRSYDLLYETMSRMGVSNTSNLGPVNININGASSSPVAIAYEVERALKRVVRTSGGYSVGRA